MSTAQQLVDEALDRLSKHPGFVERPSQRHLALLISDLIEGGSTGTFEAPTGLGKSLAILIPAIAHGLATGKRTVVGTYTNVLAEQYWRQDLPLALSLFDDSKDLKTQFLIGKQRYACLAAIEQYDRELFDRVHRRKLLGIETEFRANLAPRGRFSTMWQAISTPPVCAARACPYYEPCFYYGARKGAQTAHLIITNHNVVIQNALLAVASEEEASLLGTFDFLVLDEAHDFAQAAMNGLEFEFSESKLSAMGGIAAAAQRALVPLAFADGPLIDRTTEEYKAGLDRVAKELTKFDGSRSSVLIASPAEIESHPAVLQKMDRDILPRAKIVAEQAAVQTDKFTFALRSIIEAWTESQPSKVWQAQEASRSYLGYLDSFAMSCRNLLDPQGVAVSHIGAGFNQAYVRQDIIGLEAPLSELIWNRTPWACVSATLALDGEFDFFKRTTGAKPVFSEILPSPFDFETQAAAYLPKDGLIPDPSIARREGTEEIYYKSIANQLQEIIVTLGGRTLALFHSRKEMEAIASMMNLPEDLPLLVQPRSGAGSIGERFVSQVESSLFALRSFWTGFDAAGETCSCVALVRVPFEVPVDPPQLARAAWMASNGLDPFREYSLPQAKMLMRQGAGRLIRRAEDRGIVALLDPRLRTKRYGEEIVANLPVAMRVFDDFRDAAGWLQLGAVTSTTGQ